MIPIYQLRGVVVTQDNRSDVGGDSHRAAIEALTVFIGKYNRQKFRIQVEASYEVNNGVQHQVSTLIAMEEYSLILNNNPLVRFDNSLCWARPIQDNSQIWMHPTYEQQYQKGIRHRELVHTYPGMDIIKKVYAIPCDVRNSDVKAVLQTGLE